MQSVSTPMLHHTLVPGKLHNAPLQWSSTPPRNPKIQPGLVPTNDQLDEEVETPGSPLAISAQRDLSCLLLQAPWGSAASQPKSEAAQQPIHL
jgi:hypothetical protein